MRRIISSSLLLWAVLSLAGCYEPIEGCLDVNAVNYDLRADRNNSEDCVYPQLRLSVQHRYTKQDTLLRFSLDSVYLDRQGNPFRLGSLRYYISNFHLVFQNGQEVGVEEMLEVLITQPDGTTSPRLIEDNFSLVSPTITQNYTIGTLPEAGAVQEIRFAVGVEGLANRAEPNSFPETHPLSLQNGSMYFGPDSGYVFHRIELFRDTIATDTIPEVLRIGTEPYLREVRLPASFKKERGFHLAVTLQVDYKLWFGGIKVEQDSPEQLIEEIVSGLAQSFSVVSVQLQEN